jgi:hypothetical protein
VIHPFGGGGGGDGGNGGRDRLAAAANNTTDAGSSKLDVSSTARSGSHTTSDHARGEFDYRAEIGKLEHSPSELKEIFLRPYFYQRLPSKRVWCEYDLSVLGRGFLFGALTGFKDDPSAAIVNLEESGSHRKVGEETLFGISTTHYAGYVDLARLAQREKDPAIQQLLRRFRSTNGNRLAVEVWLSADNLLRQLQTSFDIPGRPQKVHVEATFSFFEYGITVSVKRPPRSRTVREGERGCQRPLKRPRGE